MTSAKEAKKAILLGMPHGTAAARLKKLILFRLVQITGMDVCYRCCQPISKAEELSVEHKTSWLLSDDPLATFFDLENVAFSHHACNCRAILKTRRKYASKEAAVAAHTAYTRSIYDPQVRHDRYIRNGK